jgi:hypothetical protein
MKKHTLKLRSEGGKWYVDEGYKISIFDTSNEAWQYIFLLKELRPKPMFPIRQLYPVRSLVPGALKGGKKVVYQNR